MKLIRVSYGKKNTPIEDREYRINGKGQVGCLREYRKYFPNETFEIEDKISGDEE